MKIFVTGAAGFIGSALIKRLLEGGNEVVGIDNHNPYYDPQLKEDRIVEQVANSSYTHVRADISDKESLDAIFKIHQPKKVVNLAAQAGVRYSIENPFTYINSNIVGFTNVLECCRNFGVEHLVYASSSSVYGANTKLPFSTNDNVDHPLSLYAATKKSNELMAHTYSNLFNLPTSGLRFFTVYGPWGRPDMALFKFAKSILADEPIQVFNYGKHRRDFTYIDDIISGVIHVIDGNATSNVQWNGNKPDPGTSFAPWRIYNIGNNNPVELMDFIHALEVSLGKRAKMEMLPLQPGDVPDTYADVSALSETFNFTPNTPISQGVDKFVHWYKQYYNI